MVFTQGFVLGELFGLLYFLVSVTRFGVPRRGLFGNVVFLGKLFVLNGIATAVS